MLPEIIFTLNTPLSFGIHTSHLTTLKVPSSTSQNAPHNLADSSILPWIFFPSCWCDISGCYPGEGTSGWVLSSPLNPFTHRLTETDGLSTGLLSPNPRPACMMLSSWRLRTSSRREKPLCPCDGRRLEYWVGFEPLGMTMLVLCSSRVIHLSEWDPNI